MPAPLIAASTFTAEYGGEQVTITAGESCNGDHELVRSHRSKFVTEAQYDDLRLAALQRAASDTRRHEAGAGFHPQRTTGNAPRTRAQDDGLRTIERHADVMQPAAMDRLDHHVRSNDPQGLDARYLAAVGDPAYGPAFHKLLQFGAMAPTRFSAKELEAVQRVNEVEAQRALAIGTPSAGGYAVPYQLDASIMLTSDGSLNPIRQVARVITVSAPTWKGVSSAGISASYDAELAEVSDDTPTLAQPDVSVAMGRAFVPYSIEVSMDWNGLQEELARLMADARDNLDSVKMLTGSGTNEPEGVLTGLTTTQRVLTTGTASYAIADVYALKEALPPRFASRGTFAGSSVVFDTIFRQVGGGSSEPALLPTREGPLLGRPKVEWSSMAATPTTTGAKTLIYGSFADAYIIADRIGMQAEPIAHIAGASGRPIGARGLFCWWRTGAGIVNPGALRYTEVR